MAERQYFSLRYSIPGYAFILLVIAINYVPLLNILPEFSEVFGAFLAFLSLFSGSAIGFLICQAWWWWFQGHAGIWGISEFKEARDAFFKKYWLREPACKNTDERRKFLSVFDYVTHSRVEKNVLTLAERRWDMYHILSSTYYTLWIAILVGIICRFYYEWTVFNCSFPFHMEAMPEFVAVGGLLGGIMILIFFLWSEKKWIAIIMASLYEARIRTSKVPTWKLREVFPKIYEKYGRDEAKQ